MNDFMTEKLYFNMNCLPILMFIIFAMLYPQISNAAKPRTTEAPKVRSRFKSIRCSADNVTVVINHCYLKAISRTVVTGNIAVNILVPLTKVYIQFILSYRYGLIFRPVIDTKVQDWCAIMKGAPTNPYIKLLLDTLKDTATTSAIHECPYAGEFEANNITLNYDRVDPTAIFPEGTYRITIIVYRGKTEAWRMEADEEVKSPIRENFG